MGLNRHATKRLEAGANRHQESPGAAPEQARCGEDRVLYGAANTRLPSSVPGAAIFADVTPACE